MAISVFGISAIIIAIASALIVAVDICTSEKPVHKNRRLFLFSLSKIFTGLGAISYYIGNNLRNVIEEYGEELNCGGIECMENVNISSVYLLFNALTTFVFLPTIFRKITRAFDKTYDVHQIENEETSVQYFVFHMVALMLDFEAVYTGIWDYAFTDIQNCDTNEIIGSTACIVTGWAVWTVYAITYANFSNIKIGILNSMKCKHYKSQLCLLDGLYYATLVLFFTTFFPTHILADNVEPLSCGCADSVNSSSTLLACEERTGVLEVRIAFHFYGLMMLILQGVFGGAAILEEQRF